MKFNLSFPVWTLACPALAWVLFAAKGISTGGYYAILLGVALIGAILAAVYHAEVVAHRMGEPFGTLVLAIAVTVIEASLIISLMLSAGHDAESLARDTVLAALMIILTGIIGLSLIFGSLRHSEQTFELQGVNAALAAIIAIAGITMILPNYTTSIPGPQYTNKQLGFVAVVTLIIYGAFIFIQTIKHRDYFLPPSPGSPPVRKNSPSVGKNSPPAENAGGSPEHATPPSGRTALTSLLLLVVSLVIVVLLAESLAPGIEHWIEAQGAPKSLVGIMISAVVLMPEGISAVKAARKNRLQTSLNLALGSALASMGLTIPVVAFAAMIYGWKLELGMDPKAMVLLLLSYFIVSLSLRTGRTNILQGIILLLFFGIYLFITLFP
jgi:Ca2+:H+ antiporter